MTRRLFDWYTLHRVGDPIHSGCTFFLGSWDQHHVPALEISCVLEQAETYMCLSMIKGKQLWSLKLCEKEQKKIRNHQSPITQDQDQEEEADDMHCKVATVRASFR